jgi:regulator of sigma E protease
MNIVYIIIGIIVFGILIAVHELGHFLAAKAFNVKVLEFSIGMGPRILKKQGRETLYSLRALPIGGSCLMEGEDEETPDPRSFTAQRRWKRLIILAAGAFANFVAGAIVVVVLVFQMNGFVGTTVTQLADGFPAELQGENGLMVGDRIVSINGERLYYIDDFGMFMTLANDKPVDMVVERNGRTVTLTDFPLEKREYTDDGVKTLRYGVTFNPLNATASEKLRYSVYETYNFVRLIRVSLTQLFTGSIGLNQLSGPVGIVDAMNQVSEGRSFGAALSNIAFIGALVTVNLAVMNLLPIPALDGGRIFFLVVTFFIEKISRRRVNPKYEGYIHTAGFFLLIGLMCVVMVNDVLKIVHG